jgi:putative transferase (TIGR04331 family)
MINDNNYILIADKNFINKKITSAVKFLEIFPSENSKLVYKSTLPDLLNRSILMSKLIDDTIERISENWAKHLNIGYEALKLIVSPLSVQLTTLIIDRSLRTLFQINRSNKSEIKVLYVEPITSIKYFADFNNLNHNWHYNQYIIFRIANELGITHEEILKKSEYPEFPNNYAIKNTLFTPNRSFVKKLIDLIKKYCNDLLSNLNNTNNKFLTVGLSSDDYYIQNKDFYNYNGIFSNLNPIEISSSNYQDSELRNSLSFNFPSELKSSFKNILMQLDSTINDGQAILISNLWANLFVEWLPIAYLENYKSNYKKITNLFAKKNFAAIIGSSLTSDLGIFQSIYCKNNNKLIIGVQHSAGHYGYIEDLFIMSQLEFRQYDYMLTYGWDQVDIHLPKTNFIKVPCPKLSNKNLKFNYTSYKELNNTNKKDILFISNLYHRFPHASTCGQSRVDFLNDINTSRENFVQTIINNHYTINHKPYNLKYVDLYPNHFDKLKIIGGDKYSIIGVNQKGLTIDLLRTSKIVIWDQLGSGVVECFSSKVPTMIYWDRIYSKEAPWAKEIIENLSKNGIVHFNLISLEKELQIYFKSPKLWMNNKSRIDCINIFCENFTRIDDNWDIIWKNKLLNILNRERKN